MDKIKKQFEDTFGTGIAMIFFIFFLFFFVIGYSVVHISDWIFVVTSAFTNEGLGSKIFVILIILVLSGATMSVLRELIVLSVELSNSFHSLTPSLALFLICVLAYGIIFYSTHAVKSTEEKHKTNNLFDE